MEELQWVEQREMAECPLSSFEGASAMFLQNDGLLVAAEA